MKKIFAVVLAVLMLMSFAACGDTEKPAGPSSSDTGIKPEGPAFVGKWEYSYTNNQDTVVAKAFEVRADYTATIVTTKTHADGTVEENTVDYTWELNEDGQVVTRSEKHVAVYNFNAEKDTLTNRNATAEKFTRVK